MNDSLFDEIQDSAKHINLDLNSQEMAQFAMADDLEAKKKTLNSEKNTLDFLLEWLYY